MWFHVRIKRFVKLNETLTYFEGIKWYLGFIILIFY